MPIAAAYSSDYGCEMDNVCSVENLFGDPASGVTCYADAARALTVTRAPPGVDRVRLCEALLQVRHGLSPSPAPLILRHVIYILTKKADDDKAHDQSAGARRRAAYWRLVGEAHAATEQPVGLPSALAEAAGKTLREGADVEVEAVVKAMCRLPSIRAPLEVRAAFAGAACFASGRPGVDSLALDLLKEYGDAQSRCPNPKRVHVAVLRHLLEDAIAAPAPVVVRAALPIIQSGIFASAAAILEQKSYFSSLYEWLGAESPSVYLPRAVNLLIRGCVAAARGEINFREESQVYIHPNSTGKRKVPGSGTILDRDGRDIGGENDRHAALPRDIMIPLVFFREVTRILTRRLSVTSPNLQERQRYSTRKTVIDTLASLFGTASALNIYRPSYDFYPHSKVHERKKSRKDDRTSLEPAEDRNTCAISDPDAGPQRYGFSVSVDIVAAFRAVIASIMENSVENTCGGTEDEETGCLIVGCKAMSNALELSLDAVLPAVNPALTLIASQVHSTSSEGFEALTKLMIVLIDTHSATRQLPSLFRALSASSGQLARLARLFQDQSTKSALVKAIASAPRGQAESCIVSLADLQTKFSPSDATPFALLCGLIFESTSALEQQSLVRVIVSVVEPRLIEAVKGENADPAPEVIFLRASILYAMASTGASLESDLFANSLFSDSGSCTSGSDTCNTQSSISEIDRAEGCHEKQHPPSKLSKARRLKLALAMGTSYLTRAKEPLFDCAQLQRYWLQIHLRYLVGLAHICAMDRDLISSRRLTTFEHASVEQTKHVDQRFDLVSFSGLEVVLQECWCLLGRILACDFQSLPSKGIDVKQHQQKHVESSESSKREHPINKRGGQGEMSKSGTLRFRLPLLVTIGGRSDAAGVIQLGASLIDIMVTRGLNKLGAYGTSEEVQIANRGIEKLVAVCLTVEDSLDTVWDVLWESYAVSDVLIEVLESIVADMPRAYVNRALSRCRAMPRYYFRSRAKDEVRFSECCASVVGSELDETSRQAIRVLAERSNFGENIADIGNGNWIRSAVQVDGSEGILLALESSVGDRKVIRRLQKQMCKEARNSGLASMGWLLRGLSILLDSLINNYLEPGPYSSDDTNPLYDLSSNNLKFWCKEVIRFVPKVEVAVLKALHITRECQKPDEVVIIEGSDENLAFACARDLVLLWCRFQPGKRLSPRSKIGLSQARADMNDCGFVRELLDALNSHVGHLVRATLGVALSRCDFPRHHGAPNDLREPKSAALQMICASCKGNPPVYRLAYTAGSEAWSHLDSNYVASAMVAISLRWIQTDIDAWSRAGAMLLESVAFSDRRESNHEIANAAVDAVLKELERGNLRVIRAAETLLVKSYGNSASELACEVLRSTLAQMTEWGWLGAAVDRAQLDNSTSGSEVGKFDVVRGALAGVDGWARSARHGHAPAATTWNAEVILALLSRICAVETIRSHADGSLVSMCIFICCVFLKQSSSGKRAKSVGIAWAARLLIQSALSDVSPPTARVYAACGQAHSLLSRAGSREVTRVALVDLCISLSRAHDAHARRAALAGAVDLIRALGEEEMAQALQDLPDSAKDVLRAIREEYMSEEKYSGKV
jgi:hypothetical protein